MTATVTPHAVGLVVAEDTAALDEVMPAASEARVLVCGPAEVAAPALAAGAAGFLVARPGHAPASRFGGLSERQRQVLQGVADGRSDREVARRVGLSADSVRHQLCLAFAALGVSGRAEAVAAGFRAGVLS